ncbi:MAG TPA: hypothetical protein VEI49_03785 [Terriglobales bacterium]|nr:hypothetical protein [Terriglobales bacterium]HXY15446.1 hypothetical protein [Terriglobales bacterium]
MHLLAILLSLYLPSSQLTAAARSPQEKQLVTRAHPSGKWYLAENGHAVYCYGPVLLVKQPEGTLQRVATFCKGDKTMVPLKD